MSELSVHPSSDVDVTSLQEGGFNFDNYARNVMLEQQATAAVKHQQERASNPSSSFASPSAASSLSSFTIPKPKKTGTTIAGCIFQGGDVLGADTRSTNGTEVAEKNCTKIHYVAPNIYCCGAGTAADTEKTTELIASQLELLRMDTH